MPAAMANDTAWMTTWNMDTNPSNRCCGVDVMEGPLPPLQGRTSSSMTWWHELLHSLRQLNIRTLCQPYSSRHCSHWYSSLWTFTSCAHHQSLSCCRMTYIDPMLPNAGKQFPVVNSRRIQTSSFLFGDWNISLQPRAQRGIWQDFASEEISKVVGSIMTSLGRSVLLA